MYVSKHGPEQTNVHQSKSFLKKAIDEFHLPLPKMQLSVYIEASVTQTLMLSANYNPHEFLQQIHSHELIPAFWPESIFSPKRQWNVRTTTFANTNTLSLSILNEHCCLPVSGNSNYPQFPLPTQFFTLPQMTLHVWRALYRVAEE